MKKIFCIILLTVAAAAQAIATDNDAKYRYMYMEAVRQQDAGNYAAAFELFRRCRELRPEATETCYALGVLYLAAGQDSLGMALLRRAVDSEPHNTEFAERLARTYLYQEKPAEATAVYERLVEAQPDRTDYLDLLIRLYEQQRDYPKMLGALNKLELQEGQSEDITLSKMQVYSYLADQEGAYRELKGLVDAHPHDMNLQVMMGNWLLANGRKDEARATFLKVLEEEPDNAQGQMSLMDFYRAQGETAEADKLLYQMLVNPRTEPETRVTMVREWVKDSEQNGGDSVRVMQMFDSVLQLPQATSEVEEMRVAYLMLKKAPRDSIKAGWERVLRVTPENIAARLNLIQLMWEDSIDENVIRECRKAVEYVPDEPSLYYYLGMAQYVNKHNADAIATLRRGADNITKETPEKVAGDIYAMLGDILQNEKRTQEAYAAYDSCLIYNPDNIMCLNNYAYFLSLEGKDLKRAEKMSYRAISAEPNNGTYLDTYAWILYQQQRYEEARIYIEQAMKWENEALARQDSAATDSPALMAGDILEHAGDIYHKLNMSEKALEMWQKALISGVGNEAALRRKIKEAEGKK